MQEILSQLVELQRMDTRIAEIESVITDMPQQIKALNEKLEKAKKGHDAIQSALHENKKAYTSLEAALSEKKDLLVNSQKKLTSVQNNKEYESVLRELDALKKSVSDGDAQLKDMTALNFKYESEYASINELTENLSKQLDELKNHKVDEDKELQEELAALKAKREEFASGMKKSVVSKYDRVRAHRNNIGVAAVEDEVCDGCYMRIPPQLYVDVKKDKSIYSCPHCQRILYYVKKEEEA